MNLTEYHAYCARAHKLISAAEFTDQRPRTLIYGYQCNRDTFHVYLKDGLFHRVIYDFDRVVQQYEAKSQASPEWFAPEKRAYPECCDAALCRHLELTFTTFNEQRPPADFYGVLIEDAAAWTRAELTIPNLTLSAEALGLTPDDTEDLSWQELAELEGVLSTLVSNTANAQLRAVLIHGETEYRWVAKLPDSLEFMWTQFRVHRSLCPVVLPEGLATLLQQRVTALVAMHLERIPPRRETQTTAVSHA